jgi:hypothetical protein
MIFEEEKKGKVRKEEKEGGGINRRTGASWNLSGFNRRCFRHGLSWCMFS